MALIELHDVHKDYQMGQQVVHALRGVDLEIGEREFVAVLGPSGSGKSTLLNLVSTIDQPSTGRVMVDGHDVATFTDDQRTELRNRRVGYVFQRFNLIPVLTALENVALPLELQGVSASKAQRSASAALDEVGLEAFVHHRPDHMSGGQQQRVAIARALVTQPSLVIADEPTANLDSETAERIVLLMRELNQRLGTTFIFSTHDDRLLGHMERLIHLRDGLIHSQRGAA